MDQASQYGSSPTRGQVAFDVVQTLPTYQSTVSCNNSAGMWNEALAKFGLDANGKPKALGANKHLLVVTPGDEGSCPYGFGSLGSPTSASNTVLLSGP